jgi:hypothetical protein
VAGRVHAETDDIIKLGGEVGIVGSLEGLDPVRLELMGGPDALDRSQRKTHRLGDGAAGPMGNCTGRFAQGALDHGMKLGLRHWRDAGRADLVAQPTLNAFLGEAALKAKLREGRADASAAKEVWAMDFVHDQLFDGRKIRVLTIIDTFTRLLSAIDVRQNYRGADGAATLERAAIGTVRNLVCGAGLALTL